MVKSKRDGSNKQASKQPEKASAGVRAATGTTSLELHNQLFSEAIRSSGYREEMSEQEKDDFVASIYSALQGIGPTDELEGMLAAQMIGTHRAAMDFLASARAPGVNLLWRDFYMKHATKLLSLYLQQLASLDKHRGKGQQKVTVEHVHVASGGQAIVGNVEGGSAAMGRQQSNSKQLPNNSEPPFDVGAEKKKRSPRQRK